jgi:malate/lactate dehydrogenase
VGVPARLGAAGVTEILEFDLTDAEREAFDASADHVRGLVAKLEEMGY